MKKMNKKGFTLAELLIVVAIIAVLVAIAIPVFNSQLEKSRDATDEANIRSAYAELSAALVANTKNNASLADLGLETRFGGDGLTNNSGSITFAFEGKGTNDTWSAGDFKIGALTVAPKASATTITFTVTNGEITGIALS